MEEAMKTLTKLDIPVFFVTHSSYEARKASTGTAVIYDGVIRETGKTEEIFRAPRSEWGRILTRAGQDREAE